MAVGKRINLKLFAEGLELPVIGATVQFGVRQPAMAQVEVVPNSYVKYLYPRTLVHLFYFDDREPAPAEEGVDDRRWKLLFAGELVSVRYTKDISSRSAVLTCQDFTSYWGAALKFFYNDIIFNGAQSMQGHFTGASGANGDIVFGSAAALISLIRKPCRSYPDMKGIMGGIIRILEAIGGYHVGEHTHGITDFFTQSQLRLHLYEQIGACVADDSYETLIKTASFYQWMNQIVSQGNNMFSAKDVIEAVLSVAFYNWISNPVAMFTTTESRKPKKLSGGTKAAPDGVLADVIKIIRQLTDLGALSKILGQWERQEPYTILTPVPYAGRGMPKYQEDLLKLAEEDVKKYNAAVSVMNSGAHLVDTGMADRLSYSTASIGLQAAMAHYTEFLTRFGSGHTWNKTVFDTTPVQRVLMTLFAPDIFMCAPPKCNVIYPDQYQRIEFSRSMLDEPTRYMVITPQTFMGDSSPQEIFGHLYHFAPMVKTIDGKDIKKVVRSKRFMLPHEIYSGPIPQIEWFSDIREYDPVLQMEGSSAIKKIHDKQTKAEAEERGIADQLPYLQHVAEFNFARMRYARRTMQIPMNFSPNLVAGMPAVVLDRYLAKDQADISSEDRYDEHWLGVPQSITHRITTTSASTHLTLGYVRGHREDMDIFSCVAVDKQKKAKTKVKQHKYRGTGFDLLNPPHGGTIVGIVSADTKKSYGGDVEKALTAAGVTDIEVVDEIQGPDKQVPPRKVYRVGVYDPRVTSTSSAAPGEVERAYGHNATIVRNARFDITEKVVDVVDPVRPPEDIPFEVQARPPWFSKLFTNANIGRFYNDLLGVDSIMGSGLKYNNVLAELQRATTGVAAQYGNQPGGQPAPGTLETHTNEEGQTSVSLVTDRSNSIATAVDSIAALYSAVKSSASSDRVDDMIHILTDRPIATMEEILGSADLEYGEDGKPIKGTVGFHSTAFGDRGSLWGLEDAQRPMLAEHGKKATGKPFTIDPRVDPRPGRRAAVRAYRDALAQDKKLLG